MSFNLVPVAAQQIAVKMRQGKTLRMESEAKVMSLAEEKRLQDMGNSSDKIQNIKAERQQFNTKLKDAAEGFEELFVHKMLQTMRQTIHKTGLLDGGRGEEIFEDMLDENYAKQITQTKALGLASMIYEHTKKSG